MKVFVVLKRYLSYMGIRPLCADKKTPFPFQYVGVMFLFGLFFISVISFLSFEASTFQEYSESFYALISVSFGLIVMNFYSMKADIFGFFDRLENMIESRKFFFF